MGKDLRKGYKIWRTMIACILVVIFCIPTGEQVKAASSDDVNYDIILTSNELTVYVGRRTAYPIAFLGVSVDSDKYKIQSSDESIAKVVGSKVEGLKEGTTNVNLYASELKKTLTCKVTVKYAELFSIVGTTVYSGNTYNLEMRGNTSGTQYISSNEKIATVSQDGVVQTLTTGKVTISCVGEDGATYPCKLTVKKPGLNYTKLTTVYYTGFQKGSYTKINLVPVGIQVKKFKSSNKKVAIVDKHGVISSTGVGKCTITCTAKNGKIYKCALTVEGGKKWGGLYGGYTITKSKLKTLPLYKKLNKVCDYGNAISVAYSFNKKTGALDFTDKEVAAREDNWFLYYEFVLQNRYPDKTVYSAGGDYLIVKNKDGSPYRTIRVITYYVN